MKMPPFVLPPSALRATLVASLLLALSDAARATTYDWTGATTDSTPSAKLTTAGNYLVGGSVPGSAPGGTDTVRFNSPSYTAQPNAFNSQTIGELLFDAGNTGAISFGTGTGVLTLNGVSGIGLQLNAGTGTVSTNSAKFALGANQTWLNNSTNAFTVAGTISLSASSFALTIDGTGNSTLSGAISNTGSLTKTGSGILTLSGANTYTGGTTISAGTVKIGTATSLGGSGGAVSVASGAVLDLNGQTMTNTNALTLNGTGISAGGALTNSSSTAGTYAGLVSLGSDSSIIARGTGGITLSNTGTITGSGFGLTVGGANATTIAGVIGTGTGTLTKQDSGTLTLTGVNTYTGATTINGGTLTISGTGAISSSSALVLGGGALTDSQTGTTPTQTFNGTTVNAGGGTINNATSGNTVALGAITRNTGGLLNVSSLTGTTTTSTAVDSTGILGTWATTGTGTSLKYAAGGNGGAITAYSGGTAAATAANVTSTAGTVNYDVAAGGTLGAGASVNTLRYTGAAGTIAGAFTANGLMNAGTGAVTYSGNVTIGASKELVIVGNTQKTIISGTIADNGGGASGLTYGGPSAGTLQLSGGHTFTGAITVNSGVVDLWSTTAYSNNINLAGLTATLDAANTGTSTTITLNGNITGSGRIIKNSGVSTLVLNGDNTFTGGVSTGGTVLVGTGVNNGLGTGTLTFNNGTFGATDNNSRTIANTLSMGSSALTFGAAQNALTGLGDLTFTSTASTSIGGDKTWAVNNSTTVTFNNNWTGNGGWKITKTGTGTLIFNGSIVGAQNNPIVVNAGTLALNGTAGTTTGTSTINGGTLSVAKLANGGIASSIGTTTNAATNLVIGGASTVGTLKYTGTGDSTDRLFTVGIAGGAIDASGSGAITFTNTGSVAFATGGARALTLTGGNTGGNTLAAIIGDDAGNATSLAKNGAGNWILTGANTYTGATTVSAGRLTIASTGTINGSSGVSIGAGEFNYNSSTALSAPLSFTGTGGKLSGIGTISSAVTVTSGNSLAPGNSPGLMTFGAGLTLDPGSATLMEVGGNAIAGTDYDKVAVTAQLSFGGALTVTAYDLGGGAYSIAQPATLDLFSFGSQTGNFTSVTVVGTSLTYDGGTSTWNATNVNGFDYQFALSTGDLVISAFVAIPEPSACALIAGSGLLGFALWRRRRMRV